MILKRITNIIRRLRQIHLAAKNEHRRFFEGIEEFLYSGLYKLDKSGKYWRRLGTKTPNYFDALPDFSSEKKMRDRIRSFLARNRYFRVSNKNKKSFLGTFIFCRGKNSPILIFDDRNSVVLKKGQVGYCRHRHLLEQFFPLPKCMYEEDKEEIIIEQIVCNLPGYRNEKMLGGLQLLASSYEKKQTIKWAHFSDIEKEDIMDIAKDLGDTELIVQTELFLQSEMHPKVVVHGDFWYKNILYDGTAFYVMDYEDACIDFAYLDVYLGMSNPTNVWIDDFLAGKYDESFIKIHKTLGLEFRKEWKRVYLLVAIYLHFRNRGLSVNEMIQYSDFLCLRRKKVYV